MLDHRRYHAGYPDKPRSRRQGFPDRLIMSSAVAAHLLIRNSDTAHLFRLTRAHVADAHPDTALTDDQIRAVVTANAFALAHLQPATHDRL